MVQVIVFDIKAGNVMLDVDGVTAKITDVGLSKILAGSNTATLLVGVLHLTKPLRPCHFSKSYRRGPVQDAGWQRKCRSAGGHANTLKSPEDLSY